MCRVGVGNVHLILSHVFFFQFLFERRVNCASYLRVQSPCPHASSLALPSSGEVMLGMNAELKVTGIEDREYILQPSFFSFNNYQSLN